MIKAEPVECLVQRLWDKPDEVGVGPKGAEVGVGNVGVLCS